MLVNGAVIHSEQNRAQPTKKKNFKTKDLKMKKPKKKKKKLG